MKTQLKKGDLVIVYDGDLIGFTVATLKELDFILDCDMEKWTMVTNDGYELNRFVKTKYTDILRDGCGYICR